MNRSSDIAGGVGRITDESGIVSLFAAQIGSIHGREPKQMIVFVQMTSEEQIGAKGRRVGREIAQRHVEIATPILVERVNGRG